MGEKVEVETSRQKDDLIFNTKIGRKKIERLLLDTASKNLGV